MDISMRKVLHAIILHCTSDVSFEAEVSVPQENQDAKTILAINLH